MSLAEVVRLVNVIYLCLALLLLLRRLLLRRPAEPLVIAAELRKLIVTELIRAEPPSPHQQLLVPIAQQLRRQLGRRWYCQVTTDVQLESVGYIAVVSPAPAICYTAAIFLQGDRLRLCTPVLGLTELELADPGCLPAVAQIIRVEHDHRLQHPEPTP